MSESISMSIAAAACCIQLSSCASLVALCIVDSIFLASSIRSLSLSRIEKSVGREGKSMSVSSSVRFRAEKNAHPCPDWS